MENKVKQAIKLLDGYSYVIACSDDESRVTTVTGSGKEFIELISLLMANTIKESAEDLEAEQRDIAKVVFIRCFKETMDILLSRAINDELDIDTTLDADLIKALKEELTC